MKAMTFQEAKLVNEDGLWLCFRVNEPAPARQFVLTKKQRLYDLEIKEHREKRSLDANAYAWVLMDKLAEATHTTKESIYRATIREIGGVSDTVCVVEKAADKVVSSWGRNGLGWFAERFESKIDGCVNLTLYYGSSVYDTTQMSRLIDNLVQDCKAVGIETLPPNKLAALKEEWNAR